MPMTLAYQKLLDEGQLDVDEAQQFAVERLSRLTSELMLKNNDRKPLWTKMRKAKFIPGIYFYGRVGRGKTMLMDLFYQHLSIKKKKRIHFHRFMENVHQQLNDMPVCDNPLERIAQSWSAEIDVLCFDEFFVTDIGDAMLLSGLLTALFACGVTLVATSNCQPDELYRNGLQRERFLPTIAILSAHCQVISVNGDKDHRLKQLAFASGASYRDYVFGDATATSWLEGVFTRLSQNKTSAGAIEINNRLIPFKAKSGIMGNKLSTNVIWFDFNALCNGPRSQRDYIVLANQFSTVLLEGVPQFVGERIHAVSSGVEDGYQRQGKMLTQLQQLDDEARRFIALVDELYDRKVRLIISAAVDISDLYQGQQLSFEFARCRSRLVEMQFIQYDKTITAIA